MPPDFPANTSGERDVLLTQTVSTSSVLPGETLSYTIDITNIFDDVLSLLIADAMTGLTDFISGTVAGTEDLSEGFISDQSLLDYTLASNETLTISFEVEVDYDAPTNSIIENAVTVVALYPEASLPFVFLEKTSTTQVEVVPEPTTVVFFGIGLFGIVALARRRRKLKKSIK